MGGGEDSNWDAAAGGGERADGLETGESQRRREGEREERVS